MSCHMCRLEPICCALVLLPVEPQTFTCKTKTPTMPRCTRRVLPHRHCFRQNAGTFVIFKFAAVANPIRLFDLLHRSRDQGTALAIMSGSNRLGACDSWDAPADGRLFGPDLPHLAGTKERHIASSIAVIGPSSSAVGGSSAHEPSLTYDFTRGAFRRGRSLSDKLPAS